MCACGSFGRFARFPFPYDGRNSFCAFPAHLRSGARLEPDINYAFEASHGSYDSEPAWCGPSTEDAVLRESIV
jgi:hypothetical protein